VVFLHSAPACVVEDAVAPRQNPHKDARVGAFMDLYGQGGACERAEDPPSPLNPPPITPFTACTSRPSLHAHRALHCMHITPFTACTSRPSLHAHHALHCMHITPFTACTSRPSLHAHHCAAVCPSFLPPLHALRLHMYRKHTAAATQP